MREIVFKTCLRCQQIKPQNLLVKSKQYEDGYKPECKSCHNKKNRERYHRNWSKEQTRRKVKHDGLKIGALQAYGTVCQCCSEPEVSFLTIDHVNNDGYQHRKDTNVGVGHNFYQWLKNNNYPPGFQVLCMNCNFSKYTNGGVCIHQTKTSV